MENLDYINPEQEQRNAELREADEIYFDRLYGIEEDSGEELSKQVWEGEQKEPTSVWEDIGYGGQVSLENPKPTVHLDSLDPCALAKSAKRCEKSTGKNPLDEIRGIFGKSR